MSNLNEFISSSFFAFLGEKEQEEILRRGRVTRLQSEEILFLEGDRADHMYACLHGRIRLVKYGQGSHVIVVCMADAGDIFAENVLFHYSHYPVTAIADMETTVLALQKTMMQQFLSRDRFREAFMSVVMSRMRDLTEKLVMVGGCDVEERFFRFIRSHYGMNDRISLELQKREVARYIDTTPETLSRLLNRLSSNGIVQWKKGELLVNWELWREKKA